LLRKFLTSAVRKRRLKQKTTKALPSLPERG
jgi:hypothetical protein